MNINELYEKLKEQNKDIIELLENELSTLDKDKVYDFQFEKKIKNIVKNYNSSLKIKYDVDINFTGREKNLGLMIIIINKETHLKIVKTTNYEEKLTISFFNNKDLENFHVTEKYLKFNNTVKDKTSFLDDMVISIQVDKHNKFLLESMRNEWEDYLGGSNFDKKQTLIYTKIKELAKNYDVDFLKLLLNDKEELHNLKEYIELEKLMDDSTVLEDFFVKTNMVGKLNLNEFTINKNEGLIQKIRKTKNKLFGKI